MKKVLYLTTIEVPYRTEFFNQLAKKCDLTVLYVTSNQVSRNKKWSQSISKDYKVAYLSNKKYNHIFKIKVIKYVFSREYDKIIFGCVNDSSQMLSIILMKLFRKKYILSFDGETFFEGNSIRNKLKRWLVKGANYYLAAGKESATNLFNVTKCEKIYPYYFSSLTKSEIAKNNKNINNNINECILIVGRFLAPKGLDIAVEASKKIPNIKFKFVGMGDKSNEFEEYLKVVNAGSNIEVISFLQKEDLNKEYRNCKMLVFPSKKECWGLVVNEASSFGVPIVSTWGSGAAIEFLSEKYSNFLAKSNDVDDLCNKIKNLLNYDKIEEYKKYLLKKSKEYSIEKMVDVHIKVINME